MKKLIISALLIVFGSVYAMAQDAEMAMEADTEMAMEADTEMAMEAAPSVAISGVGKMGLKQVSGEDRELSTFGEYDVKFASSGVTDGGVTFGASITLDGRANNNSIAGDGFAAYIGGADGSWKLQLGDNDQGIKIVGGGGFGLADPNIDQFDTTAMVTAGTAATGDPAGGTFSFTDADPIAIDKQDQSSDLSVDNPVWVDSATQIAADNVKVRVSDDGGSGSTATAPSPTIINVTAENIKQVVDWDARTFHYVLTGLTDDDAMYNGMTIYRHKDYLKSAENSGADDTTLDNLDKRYTIRAADALNPVAAGAPSVGHTAIDDESIAFSGTVGSLSYSLTHGTGDNEGWSVGAQYDAGVAAIGVGMNSLDVMALGVSSNVGNNTLKFMYLRRSGMEIEGDENEALSDEEDTSLDSVHAWSAYGLDVTSTLGDDSTIRVGYSKLSDKNGNYWGAQDSTQIELDYSFGLGGSATFYVEYDRTSDTMGQMQDKTKSEIAAGIKMSF